MVSTTLSRRRLIYGRSINMTQIISWRSSWKVGSNRNRLCGLFRAIYSLLCVWKEAESLLNIMANNEFTLYLLHTEKKSVQEIKGAVVEWLKQPHTIEGTK